MAAAPLLAATAGCVEKGLKRRVMQVFQRNTMECIPQKHKLHK